MRRSYIQPPSRLNQQAFPEEQRKEAMSTTNFRKERINSAISSHDVGTEKKESTPDHETKKLERKPTEDINASAEAFIKNFRQQLVIQRLQSIENYEQMLARGH